MPQIPTSELLPSGPCHSHAPGHQTHWIMSKKFWMKGLPGVVVGFDRNEVLVEMLTGETFRWWHHHPRRLRQRAPVDGTWVDVVPQLPALLIDGSWFYCSDGPTPCVLGCVAHHVETGGLELECRGLEVHIAPEAWTQLVPTYLDAAGAVVLDPGRGPSHPPT